MVYPVTISDKDITITVETDAAAATGIEGVYYLASNTELTEFNLGDFTKVSNNKIVLGEDDEALYVYVEYADHYELDTVKINGTAVESAPANGIYPVDLEKDGTAIASPSFEVIAKKTERIVNFGIVPKDTAGEEDAKTVVHGKAEIENATVVKYKEVDAEGDAAAPSGKIEVSEKDLALTINDGDKLTFRVTADEGYEVKSVQLKDTDDSDFAPVSVIKSGTDVYYETEIAANVNITVTISKIADKSVKVDPSSDISDIKTITQWIDGETGNGTDKAFSADGALTSIIKHNGSYQFAIKEYNDNTKIVDEVSYKLGDGAYVPLPQTGGKYAIDKITDDITIKITTKLDTLKVNAFSVAYNADEVTVETTATLMDAKGNIASFAAGETFYVAGNDANNTVSLTVTPKAGLKETVTGAVLNDVKTAYVIDFGKDSENKANVGKNVAVTVTTAVDDTVAVTTDQYVSFELDDEVELNVTGATKLTGDGFDGRNVFEIKKETKEVTFTATVPYGRQLNFTPDNAVVFQAEAPKVSGRTVVYSYKILVNQVNSPNVDSPYDIDLSDVDDDTVAFTLTNVNNVASAYYYDKSGTKTVVSGSEQMVVGTKIYIELTNSAYSLVKVVDGEESGPLSLDAYGKYSFVITEATELKVVAPETEKTDYEITVMKLTQGQATEEEDGGLVEEEADLSKEVITGNKFKITAKKAETQASEDIAFTKAVFAEEAASSITLDKEKKAVTVVIAADDAGKTLTVNLYTDEVSGNTTTKDVLVGTVVFKTAKPVATATVMDGKTKIANNKTVSKEALTENIFDVSISPETDKSYYDVEKVSGDAIVEWVDLAEKNQIKVTTPGTKDDKSVIAVKSGDKEIFKFTVQTVLPKLKLSKVESLAQSYNKINVTLTADKSVQAVAPGTHLYYEVTVIPQDGAPTGSAKKVLYIEKADAISQSEEITVNTADKASAIGKYNFEVRLVLSKTALSDGATAATDLVAFGNTIKKTFATKNAYYEDKLAVTKKTTTLYTGQSNVTAAVVKFSKNASYVDNVTIERVLDKDGVNVTSSFSINRGVVDNSGYEVKLGVNSSTAPGKYTVEIAAEAEKTGDEQTMYRATAALPITVVAGINQISVTDDVKVAQPGKKDVTYTIKPVGYSDYRLTKAKSQKFTYSVDYDSLTATQKANVEKNVVVNATNGKVTIKKGFVFGNDPCDNQFDVVVTANDFAAAPDQSRKNENVTIEVTRDIMQIGEMYVADGYGKNVGTSLTLDQSWDVRVVVKDTDGNDITDYVTLTPAYKTSGNCVSGDYLVLRKAANAFNVKAVTTDGGKKSKTIKLTVKNKDFTNVVYDVTSYDTTLVETDNYSWNYKATATPRITLSIGDKISENQIVDANKDVYNYSLKVVSGGVQISNDTTSNYLRFLPTAKVTKLQIKVGNTTTPITLTNDTYKAANAPKAATKDKLYKGLYAVDYNDDNGRVVAQHQELNYTVNSDAYNAVNVVAVGTDYYGLAGTYSITNKTFALLTDRFIGTSKEYGSVKYVFVYGSQGANETFIPETKGVNVTIKAANTAAYKPVTSYKLNTKNSTVIALTGKPANVDVRYSDLQNANVRGKANAFRDLFELRSVLNDDGMYVSTLILKNDATAQALLIQALDTTNKERKDNLTGYVTYTYRNTSGNLVTKTTKITVVLDTAQVKYTADAKTVLGTATTTVTTTIRSKGIPVKLSENAADIASVTTGWTAVKGTADGEIILTAASPAEGKNPVEIKFITANSENVGKGAAQNGDTATATITVVAPDKSSKKIKAGNVTADLNSSAVEKKYTTADKGFYRTALSKTYTVSLAGTVVDNMAVAENAYDVTATFDKTTDTITFTVKVDSIPANKTVKVPVNVTFEGGAAAETLTFSIITPKSIPTVETAKEAVKAYLAKYHAKSDDANLKANLQERIDVEAGVTGVTVTTVTPNFVDEVKDADGKVTTPASYTVDVTLSDPEDSANPIKLDSITVLAPAEAETAKQTTAAEALAAVAERANTRYIVTVLSTDTDMAAKQLLVSAASTRFTIRKYLQDLITGDYIVALTYYDYDAPVDEVKDADGKVTTARQDGYIEFAYGVVGQTESAYADNAMLPDTATKDSYERVVHIILPGKNVPPAATN